MYRASKIKDGYILVGEDFLALDTRPVLTPRTALGFLRAGFVMFIYDIYHQRDETNCLFTTINGARYIENKSVALGIKIVCEKKDKRVRMSCQKDHL